MGSLLFRCDAGEVLGPFPHVWEHTVGSCHAPLALRADWQAQLQRCRRELGFQNVRFHGLLSDDTGVLVRRKRGQKLLYSFFNTDQIFDFLLSIGMRPFVELSFTPEALASGSTTIFHYRANVTPPRDYREWGTLVRKLVVHWVDRYGIEEVRRWYFEVWNEPNLRIFWDGTQQEYFELYRHAAHAIKEVDAELRVGGPATAKEEWIPELLDFCEQHGLPADFVSTHHYPNDVIWYEGQETETQLANSRRGILHEGIVRAHEQARGRPLLYTEWNCSSNGRYPPQDEPYAAAFVVKAILEAVGLVESYSFWTFSDLFEEDYFPSVPFHGGFGLLTLHGVPKPSYRAFELLHQLGDERLRVEGRHATVDAWAVRGAGELMVMLTNHALPRQAIGTESVRVRLTGLRKPRSVIIQRIDEEHANAKRAWQALDEPEYLSRPQVEALEEASGMRKERLAWTFQDGVLEFEVTLPPHAVAAITVSAGLR
jgi:xylan 1,4-beta-xylosidase